MSKFKLSHLATFFALLIFSAHSMVPVAQAVTVGPPYQPYPLITDKIRICHIPNQRADTYKILNVSPHAWNGHSNHDRDFLITSLQDEARCSSNPPPPMNHAPTITLIGNYRMALFVGDTFVDPGVTASDSDGDVVIVTVSTSPAGGVNTAITGSWVITYTATDPAGLSASVIRGVYVNPK